MKQGVAKATACRPSKKSFYRKESIEYGMVKDYESVIRDKQITARKTSHFPCGYLLMLTNTTGYARSSKKLLAMNIKVFSLRRRWATKSHG